MEASEGRSEVAYRVLKVPKKAVRLNKLERFGEIIELDQEQTLTMVAGRCFQPTKGFAMGSPASAG